MSKIGNNLSRNVQNVQKQFKNDLNKSKGIQKEFELASKSCFRQYCTFEILLLSCKPTGHEVPRCCNNLQLLTLTTQLWSFEGRNF